MNFTDTFWIFHLPVVTDFGLWITEQNAQTNGRFWI
jgi:hypothetical protein